MPLHFLLAYARLARALVTTLRAYVVTYVLSLGLGLLLAFALSAPTAAHAQSVRTAEPPAQPTAQVASNIWFQVGVGGASAQLSCEICQTERDLGPAITVALGAYSSDWLRIGLEASRWRYQAPSVREELHAFGLVAHYAPASWRRLYLIGGAGWTGYRAGDFTYDAPRLTLGLGWDLPFSARWVIGNTVAFDAASFGALRNGEATLVRNVGHNALRVTTQLRRR